MTFDSNTHNCAAGIPSRRGTETEVERERAPSLLKDLKGLILHRIGQN